MRPVSLYLPISPGRGQSSALPIASKKRLHTSESGSSLPLPSVHHALYGSGSGSGLGSGSGSGSG